MMSPSRSFSLSRSSSNSRRWRMRPLVLAVAPSRRNERTLPEQHRFKAAVAIAPIHVLVNLRSSRTSTGQLVGETIRTLFR